MDSSHPLKEDDPCNPGSDCPARRYPSSANAVGSVTPHGTPAPIDSSAIAADTPVSAPSPSLKETADPLIRLGANRGRASATERQKPSVGNSDGRADRGSPTVVRSEAGSGFRDGPAM